MLTNPSYMGSMVQWRQEKINYKLEKFKKVEKQNWIVVVNMHDPIITLETFHLVQALMQDRIVHYIKPEEVPRPSLKSAIMEAYRKSGAGERMARINRKLTEIKEIIKGLYMDKIRGIIDEEMFLSMSGEYNAEKERLGREYADLACKNADGPDKNNPVDYISVIRQFASFEHVDKVTLWQLIERVEISADGQIYINYKFKNPYEGHV